MSDSTTSFVIKEITMRHLLFWLGVIALSLTTTNAHGDGLVHQLPDDGEWVKYKFQGTLGDNSVHGTLWIGSVGQVTRDDKTCRWIEVRMEQPTMVRTIQYNFKVLVPEQYLKEGENPFDHVIEGWYRKGDNEPSKLDTKRHPIWWLWISLAPPLKQVEELEPKTISTKLGELSCPGEVGIAEPPERLESVAAFEIYRHPKAPFGVVRCSIKIKTKMEQTFVFELSDFGDDAKSIFPKEL
jgi:hypothetical protein